MNVTIEGLPELRAKFAELGDKQRRGVLRGGIRDAGRVVERAAQPRVPVDQGKLRRNITTSVSVKQTGATEATIGFRRAAFYGQFVELGTIDTPAQPFLRPALEASEGEVLNAIAAGFRKHIEKVTGR